MGIPHKHAEVIKAWADGAKIQFNKGGGWEDWISSNSPSWFIGSEYRVKPKPPVKKYYYAYEYKSGHKHVSSLMFKDDEDFMKQYYDDPPQFKWFQRIDNSVKEFPQ